MNSRAEALRSAASNSFDLCVIGGGATGAGCALDAQLRGLNTVLVDRADFASGASSASTKMVHGGVRYLEQAVRHVDMAGYRVVKRALRERVHMLRNAPFLTSTCEFVTPCYSWRDVAYYRVGLKLYDWISGSAGLAPSRFLSRQEALRRIPALNPSKLVAAVAYTDGQFDDARYNIALVETFAGAGGTPLNYARVVAFEKKASGKIAAAEIEEQLSGERFTIRARAYVNATGAFADCLRHMADPGAARRMRPSRGVHILLPIEVFTRDLVEVLTSDAREESAALLIPETEDGRVLFAIPWLGHLLVGTTDEPVDRPDPCAVSRPEVEYLLRHLNCYLARRVSPEQIVSAFAGIRPLVSSGKSPGADTKELARDHVVEIGSASGLVSILGGKWTTYRAMAEDAIDAVERQLHRRHVLCRTADYPLAGSEGFTRDSWRDLVAGFGVSTASARHLGSKFGSRAAQAVALANDIPALAEPLIASPEPRLESEARQPQAEVSLADASALAAIKAEVVFCARHEMALSIEDVLARRLGLESSGWREALAAAPAVADLLAAELHWPDDLKRRALDRYLSRVRGLMRSANEAPSDPAG